MRRKNGGLTVRRSGFLYLFADRQKTSWRRRRTVYILSYVHNITSSIVWKLELAPMLCACVHPTFHVYHTTASVHSRSC